MLTLPAQSSAICITESQFREYISPEITDQHGDLETIGHWSIPVRFKAPAVSYTWGEYSTIKEVTLYGKRTLGNLKQSGYDLEGRVSVNGTKKRGFTSSQLWQLPDGRLIETSVIHVCK